MLFSCKVGSVPLIGFFWISNISYFKVPRYEKMQYKLVCNLFDVGLILGLKRLDYDCWAHLDLDGWLRWR